MIAIATNDNDGSEGNGGNGGNGSNDGAREATQKASMKVTTANEREVVPHLAPFRSSRV
jgi:hypothetical protein